MECCDDMTLELNGSKEELKNMLEVVYHYRDGGGREIEFSDWFYNHLMIEFTLGFIESVVSDKSILLEASARGPCCEDWYLKDADGLFKEIAEAAPNATFESTIERDETYGFQRLSCKLVDGMLHMEFFYYSNEVENDADEKFAENFMKAIPLKDFQKMFKIIKDNFDEFFYSALIIQAFCHYSGPWWDADYDYFIETVQDEINAESDLGEEEFLAIMGKLKDLDLTNNCDWEKYEGDTYTAIYNPVKKMYEKSWNDS